MTPSSLDSSRTPKDLETSSSFAIERKLAEYKENVESAIPIQKLTEEGCYKIGSRKVVLQLINGKLVVRIGGGFLQLKDFLEFYSAQETRRSHNKSSNEKTAE